MTRESVFEKLQDIFRDVFDNEDIEVTDDSVAEDIEEWDSLSHVQLTVEIEKVFGIKLSSREILSWDNVGEMVDSIVKKIETK